MQPTMVVVHPIQDTKSTAMKKICIAIILVVAANHLSAQTKEIAFKSHSGTATNFKSILGNELFDTDSDFGVAPVRTVKNAELDSVIFVSDSVAIMVTSDYCRHIDVTTNQFETESLWKAGSKKVYNHPLFSKKHSLDSIKDVIRLKYNFRNPVEKTVFVGYDNGDQQEYFLTPAASTPGDDGPSTPGPSFIWMLGLILGLSLLGGWVSWKYWQVVTRTSRF
jgi:hypothetical protein